MPTMAGMDYYKKKMKLLEYMKRMVIVLALMAAVVNVSAGERQ